MSNTAQPISITDLAVIKNMIDVACERGAFRAAEMKTVGEVYEKLVSFLDLAIAQAEAEQARAQPQGESNA